jgi:predicted DCC family thiol-disulfide oxidoreductase YuxK
MKLINEKIVYYDGLCGLCDGSISLILKFDKNTHPQIFIITR